MGIKKWKRILGLYLLFREIGNKDIFDGFKGVLEKRKRIYWDFIVFLGLYI